MQKKNIITTAVITFTVTVVTVIAVLFCFFGDSVKAVLIKKLIDGYYIENSETDSLLSGMVRSLNDPYSVYFNDKEYKSFMESIHAEYKGIGIEVLLDEDNFFTVSKVMNNSPAKDAGILDGDKIIEVDSQKVTEDTFNEIISYLKGETEESKNKNEISITVLRGGKELLFKVKRDTVHLDTVSQKEFPAARYIKIDSFAQNTFNELSDALSNIEDKDIILDLRDNPGGLLSSAVDIADLFLCEADIVYTQNKAGERHYFKSDKKCIENDLIVLCNKNSASASEVLTAALSDNKRALVIGEKTFGKGCVQELFPLPLGGALKLTTSYYYTPNGVCIHGEGITPSETVFLPESAQNKSISALTHEEDTQLTRALELAK